MPLPKFKSMTACMSNAKMKSEFPDTKQRIAKSFKKQANELRWQLFLKKLVQNPANIIKSLQQLTEKHPKFVVEAWKPPKQLNKSVCLAENFLPIRKAENSPVNLQALVDAAVALGGANKDKLDEVSLRVRVDAEANLRSLFLDLYMKPNEEVLF